MACSNIDELPNNATDISNAVTSGAVSAAQVTARALDRADRHSELRALRSVDRESAQRQADEVDRRIARGDRPMLAGVPVVVKDNIAQAGVPLAAGRNDAGIPVEERDAEIVVRLREAGAVVIGRANMDELAYGVTGSNPHTGQVLNPRDVSRHPGGSSAGSGAAVGAGIVPLAVGSDTGGSVRIPAALCGLVGIRPTHGLCPLTGVAPLAPSLDCVGPIASDVQGAASLLAVMSGRKELSDAARQTAMQGVTATAIEGTFAVQPDDAVWALFLAAIQRLEEAGVRVVRRSIAVLANGPRISGPIIGAEASHAWVAAYEKHPERFGAEVAGHVAKGATITAVRYLRALQDRDALCSEVHAAFGASDILILPTTPTIATPVAATGPQLTFLALTAAFSLTGMPSVSVPMGAVQGLPVGLQIVGRRGRDDTVIRAAAAFEALMSR